MNTDWSAFEVIHPKGGNASRLLARLVGRPALSLLLAGMSLPRRRFALDIPPKRTNSLAQLRFQG
ncbi:MAG: hypothetical protein WAV95_00455 [Azonexus sp.]